MNKHYKVREAAEILNISEETVRHLITEGLLPAFRIGIGYRAAYRISDEGLEYFCENNRVDDFILDEDE